MCTDAPFEWSPAVPPCRCARSSSTRCSRRLAGPQLAGASTCAGKAWRIVERSSRGDKRFCTSRSCVFGAVADSLSRGCASRRFRPLPVDESRSRSVPPPERQRRTSLQRMRLIAEKPPSSAPAWSRSRASSKGCCGRGGSSQLQPLRVALAVPALSWRSEPERAPRRVEEIDMIATEDGNDDDDETPHPPRVDFA